MSDKDIEQEIQVKGLTAPRVTPADIEANIVDENYFRAADAIYERPEWVPCTPSHMQTLCTLELRNGFTVTGESFCINPENFNAEIERKIARENAVQKIWPLMGYALKQRLHDEAELLAGLPLACDPKNPA